MKPLMKWGAERFIKETPPHCVERTWPAVTLIKKPAVQVAHESHIILSSL